MSLSGNGGRIVIMSDFQKGENFLKSAEYQSTPTYLALPDILKTSFNFQGQDLNLKEAPADKFDVFISQFVEEVELVDRRIWPIHLRWRVINACLAEGLLHLSEGDSGYELHLPLEERVPELVTVE
jgi:hypothetical protein